MIGESTASEPWRQTIAKAEILLSEGEANEDISGIADAVSAFNAALKMVPRSEAPLDWAKPKVASPPHCGRLVHASTTP